MLSRVANSVYWMSRYVERAENVARLVQVNLNLMLDGPRTGAEQWDPIIFITGDNATFRERYGDPMRSSVIDFLTFDESNPNSILSSLRAARENARSVREVISSPMWEQLNSFYLSVHDHSAKRRSRINPYEFYESIKTAGHLFSGVTDATMTHGEGWHFSQLGRFLERADKTSRIVDVKYFILLPSVTSVGSPLDDAQWAALLHSIDGFEMYRQRHGTIGPERVAEFLILDRMFPRAILHCVERAQFSLHAISGEPLGSFANPAEQRLGQLRSDLAYTRAEDIIRGGLHEFLDGFQTRLNLVGDEIFRAFFTMRPMNETVMAAANGVVATHDVLSGHEA